MFEWMDERLNGPMDICLDEWVDGSKGGRVEGWKDGRLDEWVDGLIVGWMDDHETKKNVSKHVTSLQNPNPNMKS
jgi:hypothetical protein